MIALKATIRYVTAKSQSNAFKMRLRVGENAGVKNPLQDCTACEPKLKVFAFNLLVLRQ